MSSGPSAVQAGHPRSTALRLLALSFAAGSLDALSYLRLGHVFVAFMTGNTVLLGLALGQWNLALAGRAALSLAGFSAGVAVGAVLIAPSRARPAHWHARLTITIGAEAALLVLAAALWSLRPDDPPVQALLIVLSPAAGLQSVGVQRLGIPNVTTTFVTGTLTSTIARLTTLLLPSAMLGAASASASGRGGLALPAAVFVVYGLGAVTGGAGALALGAFTIWVSTAAVVLVLIVDLAIILADRRSQR